MISHTLLKIRTAVFVSALAVAAIAPALHAQKPGVREQVNVPFGFEVGSTHFAAGKYIISSPTEHILGVQGATRSAFIMSSYEQSMTPTAHGKVVFYRYGNQYFLREVWPPNKVEHLQCTESKAEREVRISQRNGERASVAPDARVEVAALEGTR